MFQANGPRRSILDVCFGLFVAAVLVYFAVQLIVSVYQPLLVIVGVGLVIAVVVRLVLWRRQGW